MSKWYVDNSNVVNGYIGVEILLATLNKTIRSIRTIRHAFFVMKPVSSDPPISGNSDFKLLQL